MSTPKLNIRKFDPCSIKPGRIVLLVGKRGTGKSVLCKDLLYHMRDTVDVAVAMSPTNSSAETFSEFVPEALIYDEFKEDVIANMMASQRRRAKRKGTDCLKNALVIMDDCGKYCRN
jgi:type II secretory pathway predicted ATPase ExeA